jgi:hypothetical protein
LIPSLFAAVALESLSRNVGLQSRFSIRQFGQFVFHDTFEFTVLAADVAFVEAKVRFPGAANRYRRVV